MGNICYQDNDKPQELDKSKNQQSLRINLQVFKENVIVIKVVPNPKKLFDEALWFTRQERYHEALQRLMVIQQTQPTNSQVQRMIICSSILLRVQAIYHEGYQLYSIRQYGEALKRFLYIEQKLYQNYKNCRQLIHVCREGLWQQMKAKQVQPVLNIQSQLLEIREDLLKITRELLLAQWEARRKNDEEEETDTDNEEEYKNIRKQSIANFKKQEEPNFNEKPIEKLEVNYICFKKPPCKSNNALSFKHICGTIAYLDENCLISCQSKCEKYPLREALFSCKKRQVIQRTQKVKVDDYEFIDTQMIAVEFVQDCLKLDNHSETAQLEFLAKFAQPVMIQYNDN